MADYSFAVSRLQLALDSEKAIFLRSEDKDFVLQGLILDSMMHTTTSIKFID
jgi:hypothetical protein